MILLLIWQQGDVFLLSTGYVVVSAIGVMLYSGILIQHLRKQEFTKQFNFQTIQFPLKEIFSFSIPLLTTNFVYMIRHQLVVVLLVYFRNTVDVAAFALYSLWAI